MNVMSCNRPCGRTAARMVAVATCAALGFVVFSLAAVPSALGQTETVLYHFDSHSGDGLNPSGLIVDKAGNFYGTTAYGGAHGYGTVYKVSLTGKETVLYSFSYLPNDVGIPNSGLVLDKVGNLYGTGGGGAYAAGAVFKVTPTGTETVVHSFNPSSGDGYIPSDLFIDKAGNLYGTTNSGGAYGAGTVFKMTPTGTETVLYNFNPSTGDGIGHGSVVKDRAGNLYGTNADNGLYFGGQVFKVTPQGKEIVIYDFGGNGYDGNGPWPGLVIDMAGNLYGTTRSGGYGFGTVFKVTPTGTETVLYRFGSQPNDGSGGSLGDLVLDSAGNLYGTTTGGGTNGLGTVFKVTPTGTETILYSFIGSPNGYVPSSALVRDPAGNFYGTTLYGGENIAGDGIVFKLVP